MSRKFRYAFGAVFGLLLIISTVFTLRPRDVL